METPSPKYICPSCRSAFTVDMNYCGKCGADMHRASSLIYRRDEDTEQRRAPRADDTGQPDAWIGRVIDSRYRVIQRIGRGGMGVVYKVEHQRMGKIAAMKVLHRELASDREVVRRFRREAQAVSRLTHPNTVQVFDFGASGGALYLVMEYVRGRDLGVLVKDDGPLPFPRAALLFHQVCAALSEAHALGVIHRDVKPENILVTRTRDGDDFVKVLDFGLAKLTEREELAEVTDSGSIVGTPYYMSPEQIRGEAIDARSDLYSVGAVLYRVLTGEPPYRAQSPVGVLTKHLTAELVPPSERRPDLNIDPRVDDIVVRAMEKSRERRFASADELRAELEAAYAELTGDAAPAFTPSGAHLRRGSSHSTSSARARPALTPRNISLDVDYGIEPEQRLRREDLDAYERGLRRARIVRGVGLPVLIAAAGAVAVWWALFRAPGPAAHEREPNNDPDRATLIASGKPVTGYIGKRIDASTADKDVYRLRERPAADGSQVITAHVTALPNMDVALMLYDKSGRFLMRADSGGVGAEEWVRNYRVSDPLVIVVTESTQGRTGWPTENVSDSYTLTATLSAVAAGIEVEPNDMDSNAGAIAPGGPITGYLDQRGDVDAYRFDGPPGSYRVAIEGADAVPVALRVGAGQARRQRSIAVTLNPGDIVRVERDESDTSERPIATVAQPYTLSITTAE